MFRLKNVTAPGYHPPATWEEFETLDRPARIIATRHFLREAAIRLQSYGHRPDDIINAFGGIPEWISHQLHEHKCEQYELRKAWVCYDEDCGYIGPKHEFFKDQKDLSNDVSMARCPKCGLCDAGELVPTPQKKKLDAALERLGRETVVAQNIDPRAPGYTDQCVCEGRPCPVCKSSQPHDVPPIKDHQCSRCKTIFCQTCHGIKEAQTFGAYDAVQRCRCGGGTGGAHDQSA